MSEGDAPSSCASGFVPKSKLLHNPEQQYGFILKLSHHCGKNSKNHFYCGKCNHVFQIWSKSWFLYLFSGHILYVWYADYHILGIAWLKKTHYLCTQKDYFSHNYRYIIKYLFSLVIKNREICRDGKSLCSYGDFVNNLYKTGINIEVLVNYYYQFAKNGEIVLQFRR